MTSKEVKINNQRTSFSKNIKRKILLEIAKGENPETAFLKHAFESLKEVSNDKKYAAKLLYKWRKEMYENKEILSLLNHNVDKALLKDEIISIGADCEEEIEDLTIDEIESLRNCKKEIIVCIKQ